MVKHEEMILWKWWIFGSRWDVYICDGCGEKYFSEEGARECEKKDREIKLQTETRDLLREILSRLKVE